jgi:hypothetical protein
MRMTTNEIMTAVGAVFPTAGVDIHDGGYGITIPCSGLDIDFDALCALAKAFDTRDINFEYEESTPDWSEVTPGSPERCELVIRWKP